MMDMAQLTLFPTIEAAEAAIINHPTFGAYAPTSPYFQGDTSLNYTPQQWGTLINLYLDGGEAALWKVYR